LPFAFSASFRLGVEPEHACPVLPRRSLHVAAIVEHDHRERLETRITRRGQCAGDDRLGILQGKCHRSSFVSPGDKPMLRLPLHSRAETL
jgi:hypothetical protein